MLQCYHITVGSNNSFKIKLPFVFNSDVPFSDYAFFTLYIIASGFSRLPLITAILTCETKKAKLLIIYAQKILSL